MSFRTLFHLCSALAALSLAAACSSPAEKAAGKLARRIVPAYAGKIRFRETASDKEFYRISAHGKGILIEGSGANALAAGLGRYLEEAAIDVSWYASDSIAQPLPMPIPDHVIRTDALVPQRFFLNYCTFGYTMPWWQWTDWERFIDWMALRGVNMPLAITGGEAPWQKVWQKYGLTDAEIRSFFTGPAYLPWHRMCNIDGVDGPLPQGWIDAQARLQQQILKRERELGMKPVLPAFAGHVPGRLKELYPDAAITRVSRWGGFPEENRCWFLSPTDSLYKQIQRDFLEEQSRVFGTDHLYGFDLFNEVGAPSWDPETLAAMGADAFASVEAVDPEARWLQMGWLFYYDRKHWTPENIRAYLQAVPQGRMTLLDYYTEHTPIWKLTESFYGQPFIFCYLGNFGGNTRLAGPFRKESERITEALAQGAEGIGCTLEGFGINRWFYEYVLGRAWDSGVADDAWLSGLDARDHAPDGFWKAMADSIYLRGSFSEGPLPCGRPCDEGYSHWTVIHTTPYDPSTLERLCASHPSAALQLQVMGNRFASLRDGFVGACRSGLAAEAHARGEEMKQLLLQMDSLAATRAEFRAQDWLDAAAAWGDTPEEKQYYRDNAWQLLTIWGEGPNLNDYANRVWSGLIRAYYLPRWELFIRMHLDCLQSGKPYDEAVFNQACRALELELAAHAPDFS